MDLLAQVLVDNNNSVTNKNHVSDSSNSRIRIFPHIYIGGKLSFHFLSEGLKKKRQVKLKNKNCIFVVGKTTTNDDECQSKGDPAFSACSDEAKKEIGKKLAGNAVGASGGTLLVWDSLVFNKVDTFSSSHFVGVFGKWYGVNETIALVNVYGPQGSRRKDELWRELLSIMSSREAVWILFGDFNAVRSHDERFGTLFVERDAKAFNEFINNGGLHELPMGGRRFSEVVQNSWKDGDYIGSADVVHKNKIKKLKLDIKHWWHTKSAEDGAKKKEILARFEQWDTKAELGSLTSFDLLKRDEDLMELQLLVQKDSSSLKQKSKVKWAIEGDENSKFFHSMVSKKCRRQNINGLKIDGCWVEDPTSIFSAAHDYFASRFRESRPNRPKFRSQLFRRLDENDVALLEAEITMDEVKLAVWDCSSSKSPGPDGLNFKFIKRYWDTIKLEFFNYIKYFESNGRLATGCNASFIVLVPKTSDPLDLRRQILDGSLIANEIVNFVKEKKINLLLFKVDFEKAFDSVNWNFLLDTMSQMNFGPKWCNWISSCLSSSSVSVLVNGSASKEFKMECGLRQGDPLSPFLFLIVAEVLQVMIVDACNKGIFKGLSLADDGSNISLLQYADDALFFGEWSASNARHLVRILDCFHDVSGLKINLSKSRLFGIGIPIDDVASVARAVNCSHDSLPFTYLGLPVGKSMKRVDAWNDVVLRLTKRLAPWKNNLLSIGGRLTLVKSVLGSLPLYYLSIFRAPSSIISSIESIRRRFFWGYKENEKKIVWVQWQKVIADKKDGGLGVGSIKAKNLSLLGKWRWRFLNEKDALWSKVISKIYGSDGGFDVRRGSRQKSSIWGSIIGSCSELNQFFNTNNIHHLDDKWTWALEDTVIYVRICEMPYTTISLLARQILRLLGGTLGCLERSWREIPLIVFNPSLSDILMGSFGFIKDEWASRAFHGVCLTALWHIWNLRNKVSHATSLDEKNDYCNEDIFPVVQRVSLLWDINGLLIIVSSLSSYYSSSSLALVDWIGLSLKFDSIHMMNLLPDRVQRLSEAIHRVN
ncbi:putative RNA-directed DNA polymerase [Tanacetum coccineum]